MVGREPTGLSCLRPALPGHRHPRAAAPRFPPEVHPRRTIAGSILAIVWWQAGRRLFLPGLGVSRLDGRFTTRGRRSRRRRRRLLVAGEHARRALRLGSGRKSAFRDLPLLRNPPRIDQVAHLASTGDLLEGCHPVSRLRMIPKTVHHEVVQPVVQLEFGLDREVLDPLRDGTIVRRAGVLLRHAHRLVDLGEPTVEDVTARRLGRRLHVHLEHDLDPFHTLQ